MFVLRFTRLNILVWYIRFLYKDEIGADVAIYVFNSTSLWCSTDTLHQDYLIERIIVTITYAKKRKIGRKVETYFISL